MSEEEKIALVRLLIGDTVSSPFYPLFTDEQIAQLLVQSGGDVIAKVNEVISALSAVTAQQ